MITKIQSINRFESRMDDLLSSNYILADKKITAVLKAVTASKLFYGLISFCADGFDYGVSFNRAFKNGEFRKPSGDKEFIALGFYLFSDFDSKRADLFKLLEAYFPADNYDKSYKEFCARFLLPFKNAVVNSAKAMVEIEEEEVASFSPQYDEGEGESTDRSNPISGRRTYSHCFADAQKLLALEQEKIIQAKIKADKKSDLLVILGALKDSFFLGDKPQIRVAFLSYKYAVMNFKRLDTEVDELERILKFCNIL